MFICYGHSLSEINKIIIIIIIVGIAGHARIDDFMQMWARYRYFSQCKVFCE